MGALGAALVAAACKDSSAPGRATIPRAALNGTYNCTRMFALYRGPQGAGWYTGTCGAYIKITDSTRADSIETFPFTIYPTDIVRRRDFPDATLVYDSTARIAVMQYEARPTDVYDVSSDGSHIVFDQRFNPFDFSGDGQPDSLLLRFVRQ
jgi:hypothetical protein